VSYRLDELAELAAELELESRRIDAGRLAIVLQEAALVFRNLPDGDTLVGFDGTPWHSHGTVLFSTGDATGIECDELDLFARLGAGELVIISQLVDGELRDRWIAHRDEPLDVRYIQPGEEIRVFRLRSRRHPR
jgi:hypothetical protein